MKTFLKRVWGAKALPEKLSYEDARAVLETHARKLQEELAGRGDAEPEMLYYLAESGSQPARRTVAMNPATPTAADRLLADDVDPEVREELARKIGRLLPDLLAPEHALVCQQTLETLDRLAADHLPRVRAILAEGIGALTCVPRNIVAKLARDVEETVCVPILEYSPLLADGDLLEIIASARVQGALAAIARRKGLSETVSDAVVATLDIPAIAALLANADARIRDEAMDEIIGRAETIAAWHGPLVMRADLSLRVLRRVAGFVGTALLEDLTLRNGLDSETKEFLSRTLRARLEREDFRQDEGEEDEVRRHVDAVFEQGGLDERFVEQAAEAGQRDIVVEVLARLAKAPRPLVEKILASRSGKAITSLAWRAGLSMRTAFKIQALLVKLKSDEVVTARAGVGYPLKEEEMRWHLSYFGLTPK